MLLELVISLGLFSLVVSLFLIYSGVFTRIKIKVGKPPLPGGIFLYQFKQADYREASNVFRELRKVPLSLNQTCMGIYYDNPDEVPEGRTRFAAGLFIPHGAVSDEIIENMSRVGFSSKSIPEITKAVTTVFPYRNPISVVIGIYRVYPALGRFNKEHGLCPYPYIEFYQGSQMHFIAALEKQNDFFVDEHQHTTIDDI